MIILIIIKLSKKLSWLDRWIKQFIELYNICSPPISIEEIQMRAIDESRLDLERVMTYEKLGKLSGLPAPRIIKQPR